LGMTFDVGHAEHLSRLGFYPYKEWLERFSLRILETHMHDVRGIVDHYTPGMGEVDFSLLATYLPDTAIRTCEFIDTNSPEDVISGLRYLAQNGCVQSI
jgi:sugar phosphate isomerase/epimerase